MDWASSIVKIVVITGAMLFLNKYGTEKLHPLHPWQEIGSSAKVNLINETYDTISVWAQAPAVDNVTRFMGEVLPCDSAILRVPYADTKVTLIIGNIPIVIQMNKPLVWRIVAK